MTEVLVALAPGALLLIVAGASYLALARWFDPIPKRIALLFLGVVLALFARSLFLSDVLLPLDLLRSQPPFRELPPTAGLGGFGDQFDLIEDLTPYLAQVRAALSSGEWPLLARSIGAGEPLLGNTQAQVLHPFVVLTYALPLPSIFGVIAALKVLTAFAFTFLLCRRLGLREASSTGAALAYGLSGFMTLYLGWPHTAAASALPLLLYAIHRRVENQSNDGRDLLLLAAASFTVMTAGHPETMLYVTALATCYGLELAIRAHTSWLQRRRAVGQLALAALLGGALAAPVLLPANEARSQSERQRLVEMTNAARSETGLGEALRTELEAQRDDQVLTKRALPLVAPLAYGSDRYGESWGFASIIQEGSGFAGTACVLIVLIALAHPRHIRRTRPNFPLVTIIGGAAAGMLFHVQPPGLVWLMSRLPLLSQSGSENRRLVVLLCFCLAVGAAAAWQRVLDSELRARRVLGCAIVLALLIWWGYAAHPHPERPFHQAAQKLVTQQVQIGVVIFLTALLLHRRRVSPNPQYSQQTDSDPRHSGEHARGAYSPRAAWGLAVAVGVELFLIHSPINQPSPRSHFYPQRPSITVLQQAIGDDRMVGLGGYFHHNETAIYGLDDIRSGSPLQPVELMRLTRHLRPDPYQRQIVVGDDPVLDLLGVSLVTTGEARPLPPHLPRLYQGELDVHARPNALPRLFLAKSARAIDGIPLDELRSHTSNFRVLGFVDRLDDSLEVAGDGRWVAEQPERSSVDGLTIGTSHLSAFADISHTSLLASSQYQDGGWTVLTNGKPAKPAVTNGIFVGAWLDPGEQRLDVVYRPPGFLLGCLVAAIAAAALIALTRGRPR